jgi:hypothetical protein
MTSVWYSRSSEHAGLLLKSTMFSFNNKKIAIARDAGYCSHAGFAID